MRLKSISIGCDGVATAMFADGKKERKEMLFKCPFPECGLYHVADSEVCLTIGKSIMNEVRSQEEEARRKKLAENERSRYLSLQGETWQSWVPFMVPVILFFVLWIFMGKEVAFLVSLAVSFVLIVFVIFWETRRRQQVKNQADFIYQRVLESGKVEEAQKA